MATLQGQCPVMLSEIPLGGAGAQACSGRSMSEVLLPVAVNRISCFGRGVQVQCHSPPLKIKIKQSLISKVTC